MNRMVCVLVSVILCIALLSVSASAEQYDLSSTDLSIRVDDTIWYVFTRDNLENNPELEELGIAYDAMYSLLYENEVFMDAIAHYEDGEYIELFVRKRSLDSGMANLTNYENDQVLELAEQLAKKQGTETYSVYENGYKFAKLEYFDSNVNAYICEYVTFVNKDNYTFTFQSASEFADWKNEEIEQIINSIHFNVDPSIKEKKTGSLFGNVLITTIGGAAIGGAVGAVISIVNKKKKAAPENVSPANTPETE